MLVLSLALRLVFQGKASYDGHLCGKGPIFDNNHMNELESTLPDFLSRGFR